MNVPVPVYGLVPPVADTEQLNGLPAVMPDVGHVTVTMRGCGATATLAEPEAVTWFASVTEKVSVKVPLTGWVTVNEPVPVYGPVPPVALTVQLNGLPAVAPVPQFTVTIRGCGPTLTEAELLALAPLESPTVKLSVNVPLTDCVTLNEPVPVYGEVPPDAETVHVKGLPAVTPEDGHVTVTTRGCGLIDTGMFICACAPLASLTNASMLYVPLTSKLVVNVGPVPSMVPSLLTSQLNWYGAVPPVADASQLVGLPAVPAWHDALTTSGCARMVTGRLIDVLAPLASVTIASIE